LWKTLVFRGKKARKNFDAIIKFLLLHENWEKGKKSGLPPGKNINVPGKQPKRQDLRFTD
jgi:hypothetical protein